MADSSDGYEFDAADLAQGIEAGEFRFKAVVGGEGRVVIAGILEGSPALISMSADDFNEMVLQGLGFVNGGDDDGEAEVPGV
jgi:hypothetical protein